jgi:hypothetical protein
MAAGTYDITIEQGATFRLELVYKDDAAEPIDLTGYTARMKIKITNPSVPDIIELTTENGGIIITPLTGMIELYISEEDTEDLRFTTAVYDLELINEEGVQRLIQGSVSFSKEVTK